MRRKEKRLLQAAALVLAALVLLPNVGLWALYRERQPDGTPGGAGAAAEPVAGQVSASVVWDWDPSSGSFLYFSCVIRGSAKESAFPI